MVEHFGGVARGQRSFAYEKILYLIGLKYRYAVSFLFWSKIENLHKIIERKYMVKLCGVGARGRAPFPKKIFDLISIKYAI